MAIWLLERAGTLAGGMAPETTRRRKPGFLGSTRLNLTDLALAKYCGMQVNDGEGGRGAAVGDSQAGGRAETRWTDWVR